MKNHLHHKEEMLLNGLLAGKLPRNLSWSEVVDLIEKLGEVQPHVLLTLRKAKCNFVLPQVGPVELEIHEHHEVLSERGGV